MTKQQFGRRRATDSGTAGTFPGPMTRPCTAAASPGFKPATVTLEAAAKFIAWHCLQLNGQFDGQALNELRALSRKHWLIC